MKSIFSILITLILASCNNTTKTKDINESKNGFISVDTILVKIENEIDRHYDIGFIKKSFFYYWVTEKDTLDFAIGLKEYVRDGSVNLRIYHRNPILFSDALAKISDCLPLIEQDFN